MTTPKATPNTKAAARIPKAPAIKSEKWKLRLYIAGHTPKSIRAIANLKVLCEEQLKGRYRIEVVDLIEHPHLARGEQIVAVPTLVRRLPLPIRNVIGDLSNKLEVLVGLDLRQAG